MMSDVGSFGPLGACDCSIRVFGGLHNALRQCSQTQTCCNGTVKEVGRSRQPHSMQHCCKAELLNGSHRGSPNCMCMKPVTASRETVLPVSARLRAFALVSLKAEVTTSALGWSTLNPKRHTPAPTVD